MQHLLTPYSRKLEPFAWWEDGFSQDEIDWLQQKAISAKVDATVFGDNLNTDVRRSKLNWMSANDETRWVYEKLSHIASRLNEDYFGFDLTGFGEHIQMTNYSSENQGEYKLHQDFGGDRASRKLSMVMQLSDPSDYDGGELQIMINGRLTPMQKKRGLIIAFPSWTLHQVTPVIRGTRQSLVTWVSGPGFK